MKQLFFLLFISILTSFIQLTVSAQDDTTAVDPNWKIRGTFGFNITQSSFTNWAAGGRNNLAGLAFSNAQANYKKGRVKWSNTLALGLGGVQYFDEALQKTDDLIDLQSTYSYGVKEDNDKWYFSALAGFRTQFIDGFVSPTDTLRSSTFMAPGYGNLSLGMEYVANKHFRIMASPLSGKFTFVNDERLANAGAFGVTAAQLDGAGNVLVAGRRFRPELGSFVRIIFEKEIMPNIDLRTRWEFFSNYLENPQNIDVNAELIMNFKVNKWFSANLTANLIYDDDITITDSKGGVGPRTQFKQVIGIGVAYRVANVKEE
jgi:hypothetical protein